MTKKDTGPITLRATVSAGDLATTLNPVVRVTGRKQTLPVASHAVVEAVTDRIEIAATDFNVRWLTRVPAIISTPGRVLVPAAKLQALAALMPSDAEIAIEAHGTWLVVTSRDYAIRIETPQISEFPSVQPDWPAHLVELPSEELVAMLAKVGSAVPAQDYRQSPAAAHFQMTAAALCLRATDGHRAVVLRRAMPVGRAAPFSILVPKLSLGDLAAIAACGETVSVAASAEALCVACGVHRLIVRLIEGTFPALERIFDRPRPSTATVSRDALAAAVRRVALVLDLKTPEQKKKVRLEIDASTCRVSGVGEAGESQDRLPSSLSGPAFRVVLDVAYLLQFLSSIPAGGVTLSAQAELGESTEAVLCRPVGQAPLEHDALIMPMRA